MSAGSLKCLSQKEASKLDEELVNEYKFDILQLMELAGLSCASAIAEAFPDSEDVLIIVGPGNNGADGLVCARHLKVFGYSPKIYYPKQPKKYPYDTLKKQCESFNIPFLDLMPTTSEINENFKLVVDALFGFSFKPPVRMEYEKTLDALISTSTPCCSIDIPSGWDVDEGPVNGKSLEPVMLISLTAPKMCSKFFKGKYHYLGGRFLPTELSKKYDITIPKYFKANQCVKM
nr:EOG090X0AXR [Macrothrix elegans]